MGKVPVDDPGEKRGSGGVSVGKKRSGPRDSTQRERFCPTSPPLLRRRHRGARRCTGDGEDTMVLERRTGVEDRTPGSRRKET